MATTLREYEQRQYLQYMAANTCACCGEKIIGRVYNWEGENYCEDCFDEVVLPEEIKPEYEVKW